MTMTELSTERLCEVADPLTPWPEELSIAEQEDQIAGALGELAYRAKAGDALAIAFLSHRGYLAEIRRHP